MRHAALRMPGLAVFEDIPDSSEGADKGLLTGGVDLAAQAIDVDVDDVCVRVDAHAPDFLKDHGAGDDAAGVAAEVLEEDELLWSELEGLSGAHGFAAEQVELEVENAEAGGFAALGGIAFEE